MRYKKKNIWGPVELEKELKRQSEIIKEECGFPISPTDIGYKLANDLKNGNIKLLIPVFKSNNQKVIKVGNEIVKLKKKK